MQGLGKCGKHGRSMNDPSSQLTRILCIPTEACLLVCRKPKETATLRIASLFSTGRRQVNPMETMNPDESIPLNQGHAWVHGSAFATPLPSTKERQTY